MLTNGKILQKKIGTGKGIGTLLGQSYKLSCLQLAEAIGDAVLGEPSAACAPPTSVFLVTGLGTAEG